MQEATKERLHESVDALPEGKIGAANKYLECLVNECDPVLQAFLNAPEDDEPLSEDELKAIEEGRKAVAEGRVELWEDVQKELGL